jgi:DNA processing protein
MDLARPRYVFSEALFAARPERARGVRFAGLWVTGTLDALAQPTVAIVGSRAPSDGGRARAKTLAATLAMRGVCVVSGLALGIDAAAHLGAVECGRATIGVLGGGHDHFFPVRNAPLAAAMLAHRGGVLSPYHPKAPARPGQFLQRNAIVAALADVVVVVEAAERSGALNTAHWANEMGIDVLAFPGDVDRPLAAGCNELIRDGAILVRGADDVLEALGRGATQRLAPSESAIRDRYASEPQAIAILDALQHDDLPVDTIAYVTGLSTADALATLVRLEVEGAIERRDGTNFGIRREA